MRNGQRVGPWRTLRRNATCWTLKIAQHHYHHFSRRDIMPTTALHSSHIRIQQSPCPSLIPLNAPLSVTPHLPSAQSEVTSSLPPSTRLEPTELALLYVRGGRRAGGASHMHRRVVFRADRKCKTPLICSSLSAARGGRSENSWEGWVGLM